MVSIRQISSFLRFTTLLNELIIIQNVSIHFFHYQYQPLKLSEKFRGACKVFYIRKTNADYVKRTHCCHHYLLYCLLSTAVMCRYQSSASLEIPSMGSRALNLPLAQFKRNIIKFREESWLAGSLYLSMTKYYGCGGHGAALLWC